MHFLLQGATEELITVLSERQEFQGQLKKVNASSYIHTLARAHTHTHTHRCAQILFLFT